MVPDNIDEIKTIRCTTKCDQRITHLLQHGWKLIHVHVIGDEKEFIIGHEKEHRWDLGVHTLDQSPR